MEFDTTPRVTGGQAGGAVGITNAYRTNLLDIHYTVATGD